MNEQELRHALRTTMAVSAQPPSMSEVEMLDTARRAHRRRRATLAGVASAAAVVVIAAGTVIVGAVSGDDTPSGGVGAQPSLTMTAEPPGNSTDTADPPGNSTETQWPDGQTDRTARQGPRYDRGVQLLDLLTTALPPGLESPADLKPVDPELRPGDLRRHQASFADEINGKQLWEYLADIPVGANGRWGVLRAKVYSAGNDLAGEGCALTTKVWGTEGTCVPVDVGGKQVGVVTKSIGDGQLDQGAAYQHPDGTLVLIAQATSYEATGLAPLAEPPLPVRQLAELAADPKFRLD